MVVWLLATVVALARLLGDPGLTFSGDTSGLLPPEHRAPTDEPLLLLSLDDDSAQPGDAQQLLSAATAVAEQLGDRRVPLGPPATELTAWLDAHRLYLLPTAAHETLAQRLSDPAIAEAVDALRAQLSSPLYGVSGEQPRRDPLRLSGLAQQHAGRLTHLGSDDDMAAELTVAGDLLSLDGRALLMQLRTEDEAAALLEEIESSLEGHPVVAHLVGPRAQQDRVAAAIAQHAPTVATLALAGLVLVLSLALRAIRPVAAIVAALASAIATMLAFGPAPDLHGFALLVLLAGFGCEGAMHLSRISPRGWPAAIVLAGALLPLWLLPYPQWYQSATQWAIGLLVVVALLRLVVPALLATMRFSPQPARRGFVLRPLRPLAVVLAIAALAGGGWSLDRLPHLPIDRTARPASEVAALQAIRERFFDPSAIVRAESVAEAPAAALSASAEHARQLATLVPKDALRVDSPGRLVLPEAQLESRRRSLATLDLPARMDSLREQLVTRGFRPDAFGEFLRGAAQLEQMPTPTAAMEGPLGPWISGYMREQADGRFALVTRVHLQPDPTVPVPALEVDGAEPLRLMGPAVAARRDRAGFADGLGLALLAQLWFSALVVWIATRRLPIALACAVASLSAQTALLAVMVPLGVGLGAALLPAILLVGAAATIAGARACRSVALGERFYAMGVLLSSLCQAAAGLALVASTDPLWSTIGLVIAVGSMLAAGAGLFVAPGMMRLFGGGTTAPTTPPEPSESSS